MPAVAAAKRRHSGNKAFVRRISLEVFRFAIRLFAFCLRELAVIIGQFNFFAHMADNFIHQKDYRHTVFFAQRISTQSKFKAFGNAGRGQGNQPVVAVGAVRAISQWSPWVPQRACIKSPWEGLVGWPVDGPTRCTLTITRGISAAQA